MKRGLDKVGLRELCEQIKRSIDYRSFFLRYCRVDGRGGAGSRVHVQCPIPTHQHSGQGSHSLSLDFRRGLFHCFSRGEGGDAIHFYELMHEVSLSRAVQELARELGLEREGAAEGDPLLRAVPEAVRDLVPPLEEPLDEPRMSAVCEAFLETCRREEQIEGINYLARRGIAAQTLRRASIVYFPRRAYRRVMRSMLEAFALDELQRSGLFNAQGHLTFYKHRLLFPFYVAGRVLYLQARTTASGVEPRWHNMRGGVPSLYNVDALADLVSGHTIYLVEGFTDTLTLLTHGFTAVGLVGAGGFKEEWLAPLARFRVVAALDGDAAGERAAARYREMFAARGMSLAQINLASDVSDFFRHHPTAPLEFALLSDAALAACET